MAGFEKGKPKTGGKTKGTPNKKTLILETFCEDIIEGGIGRFNEAMETLAEKNPTKYIDAYLALLEYVKPKLARQDVNLDAKGELSIKWIEEKTYESPKE
jgi:hypothetical protein